MNNKSLFYDLYKEMGLGDAIYKPINNRWLKILRRIHSITHIPFFHIWYTKEFKEINVDVYNTIIIFDSSMSIIPANYIKKCHGNLRVVFWHWNHIYSPLLYKKLDKKIERWSYDGDDCSKYDLKFNTQFYFSSLYVKSHKTIERDCFFIGKEKGRTADIECCKTILDDAGLSKLFIVSGNSRLSIEKEWVDYDDIINYITTSRCVIDIVPQSQQGLTLRPLEALFHHKKLITNFKRIKEYPFYSKINIFIIGEDDVKELNNFVKSPFDESVIYNCNYYDFNTWLKRFYN